VVRGTMILEHGLEHGGSSFVAIEAFHKYLSCDCIEEQRHEGTATGCPVILSPNPETPSPEVFQVFHTQDAGRCR
jgi:hypothetical protein